MKNIAYYNGKFSTLEELAIPALDRAVYFGDGVYEAAYFDNGIPYALDDHMRRFKNSLRFVSMAMPMEEEALESMLRGLCEKIDGEGIVYWQASRGTAPRLHTFPENCPTNIFAWAKEKPIEDLTQPLKLITTPDIRYKMCNVKTLNLMPNVMASQAAKDAGCDEAVFIRDGYVTECSHTNIHILAGGRLITHENCELILPGTVRAHLISVCEELGIPVEERPFTVDEIYAADEVLITSATSFFRHVCQLDGKPVGGRDRAMVERLQRVYLRRIADVTGRIPASMREFMK